MDKVEIRKRKPKKKKDRPFAELSTQDKRDLAEIIDEFYTPEEHKKTRKEQASHGHGCWRCRAKVPKLEKIYTRCTNWKCKFCKTGWFIVPSNVNDIEDLM